MNQWHLFQAAQLIKQGGVMAYPTETVWGLGCQAENQMAAMRIIAIKGRAYEKGVILLCADWQQVAHLIQPLNSELHSRIGGYADRPTTFVVPASSNCPEWLTGGRDTLAVRIAGRDDIKALCAQVGPIISTSANFSSRPAKLKRYQCIKSFHQLVDWVMPGEVQPKARPSRIVDLVTGKILRD